MPTLQAVASSFLYQIFAACASAARCADGSGCGRTALQPVFAAPAIYRHRTS